jgi:hypothetical protein
MEGSYANAAGVDIASLFDCGSGAGLLLQILLVFPGYSEEYLLTEEERN